jgi:predicted anti-sigma-YlaC factor YlaD
MTASDEHLLQRYHDGELGRADAAAIERLLAERPELRELSRRVDRLDGLMRERAAQANGRASDPTRLIAAMMERLPQRPPQKHLHLSMAHLALGALAVAVIGLGYAVAGIMRDLVPVGAVAVAGALIGLTLVLAARPLMAFEASLFARLMRQRLSVGDGEVLVCRVLGVALIIGGIHVIGVWG